MMVPKAKRFININPVSVPSLKFQNIVGLKSEISVS